MINMETKYIKKKQNIILKLKYLIMNMKKKKIILKMI